MKKKLYLIIFWFLIICQIACGQSQPPTNISNLSIKPEESKVNYQNLKTQAERINTAFLSGDYNTVVDYTHPKVVEKIGGREKMVTALMGATGQMKNEGSEILSAEVGEIKQVEKIDNQLFVLLLGKMVIRTPQGKVLGDNNLVCISEDDGKTWKFISSVSQEKLNLLFPKAAEKLQIPKENPPIMLEN